MALKSVAAFMLSILVVFAQAQERRQLLLFDLSAGATIALSNPSVIDSSGLIEDAPSFHPTAPLLYYAAADSGQFSINSFHCESSERSTPITSDKLLTGPRIMPSGKHLTFLEAETSTEYVLKKVDLLESQVQVISRDHAYESYHWMDDNTVLGVVAGDPNELMLISLRPKRAIPVAKNVGGVLQASHDKFFFVHKLSVDSWSLKEINRQGSIAIKAQTLEEADRFAALPDGDILMAKESDLYLYRDKTGWKKIHVPGPMAINGILNLAINQQGTKLAMLVELSE
jgi:hypothetical protein